ncbi:MAG TPA: hypothetical protein PK598_09100 [Thermoanaerobaculia bacterium]|nr:hypothetical protein [Thermoanaerobaculia bacterium]
MGVVDPPRFRDPLASRAPAGARTARRRFLALGAAALVALLLGRVFPVSLVAGGISLLVHELGHTAASILFGSFAVPAVVLTVTFEQTLLSVLGVWALLLIALWRFRSVKAFAIPFGAFCAIYPFLARSPLHVSLITLAGHGAEVGCAAFFLFRAAAGELEREWERPGWALLGFLLWFRNVALAWGLRTSREARTDYLTVSFAGDNDFVRIAKSSGLPLESVGGLFLLVAVAVPAAALAAALLRRDEAP